jgi:hypothetical protein
MATVLLAVLVFVGFSLLVSAVCERELLRAEGEEKPRKVADSHQQDGRGQEGEHLQTFTENCTEKDVAAISRSSRSRIRTPHPVPSENDEVAA